MEKLEQEKKITIRSENFCNYCGKKMAKGTSAIMMSWGKYDPEGINDTAVVCSELCRDELICRNSSYDEPLF